MAIFYDIKSNLYSVPCGKGWTFEINYLSWGRDEPKLDFRKWSDGHDKMSKGITLTVAEAKELFSNSEEILKVLEQL